MMVYCGKPSRGCENCRKLHVKCDEKRPECSRCLRMGKLCCGYRDPSELMFRDETARTEQRARSSVTDSRRVQVSPAAATADNQTASRILATGVCRNDNLRPHGWDRTLSPSLEDLSIFQFHCSIMENLPHEDHAWYIHSQLPNLYTQSGPDSALRLATQAISYAFSSKMGYNTAGISRYRYVKAIKAVDMAIRDPLEVQSDQILYAVLLLCGYETIMCDSKTPPAWGAHVDGAAALVKLRGNTALCSPLSRNLFFFVRKNIVLSHTQTSQPIDKVFIEVDEIISLHENVEDQLISKTIKLPNLQYLAKNILIEPCYGSNKSDILDLRNAARTLDHELSVWANSTPPTWSYSVAMNLNLSSNIYFTPHQVHRYPSLYIARVWNMYRVSRLIVQSILLRVDLWLVTTSVTIRPEESDRTVLEEKSRDLVDDICASVPFLLGHNLSKIKLPTIDDRIGDEPILSFPDSSLWNSVNGSTRTGRFSLIWPLYVGNSVGFVPDFQRRWMCRQLRQIAGQGEQLAKVVCMAESKVLSGGAESFRFDCV